MDDYYFTHTPPAAPPSTLPGASTAFSSPNGQWVPATNRAAPGASSRATHVVLILVVLAVVVLGLRFTHIGSHTTLKAPETLLGYSLMDDPLGQRVGAGVLRGSPPKDRVIASWGDSTRRLSVMVAKQSMTASAQKRYVETTLDWGQTQGLIYPPVVDGITGSLGGTVKCANDDSGQWAITVCAFADDSAYGLIFVAGHDAEKKAEFIRQAVERRTRPWL